MSKHTPGPWDASGLTVYDTCMDAVASVHSAADARLIAAAPEMLGALLYIRGIASRNAVERSYSAEDQRRAIAHIASLAIAKAECRS